MKVAAWIVFLLLSACFCISFYAQQVESRSLEVREMVAMPDAKWQKFLRQSAQAPDDKPAPEPAQPQPVTVVATNPADLPY